MRHKVGYLLAAFLIASCDSISQGETEVSGIIRAAIGMNAEEFNAQPALSGNPARLDPTSAGVITIDYPHELLLNISGRAIGFESGGENASTYVRNGYSIPDKVSDPSRIASIDFRLNRELLTLADAVDLAIRRCEAMRAAGLRQSDKDRPWAYISDSIGKTTPSEISNPQKLMEVFSEEGMGAIVVSLCNLEDSEQSFGLQIVNVSPLQSRSNLRSELGSDRIYRVEGHLGQQHG